MHVISRKKLSESWKANPALEAPLSAWFRVAEASVWRSFSDVRATISTVDQIDRLFVFNILGNRYRLICHISFEKGKLYVLDVLTHAEYSRDRWKVR
jgi:mRNA interferase HigB